ncbi:MAG: amidohydrolase family protein, partial [Luteimonas sp.]|nr:amidohydrolase family protein [Luteimonas sp.]
MRRIAWIVLLCGGAAFAQAAEVHLLTAARIHTSDPSQPQAAAMAWGEDGRILAVGDAGELLRRYPGARRIDVGDATVVPGLIDAHAHIVGLGLALTRVDLVGTKDKQEILERLRAFARDLPADAWLLGGGWDQN